ncbi:tyrosine-protein kinase receptor TYRO3 isoform X2 [Electrophorus electricus]|nr:tyrosine-protein kinase receptor TYRO3 isoform X2 [Electrophorus electricus]
MGIVFYLLSLSLFSMTFFGSTAQLNPVEEEILNSMSQEGLQWKSEPEKSWQEIKMKLGQDFSHSVYQGCNVHFKNKLKTLWTTWVPRKDAHELLLDLHIAQDDQTPVTVELLESDKPVKSPSLRQRGLEVVAPSAFPDRATPVVVAEHLYHAHGLHLGKISKKGFHLGFSYSGSCMLISSVRIFYVKCPGYIRNQTSFEEASAGSGWNHGHCVDGAEEVSGPKMECQSNGEWGALIGSCACKPGFQADGDICQACKPGTYKPFKASGQCQLCPSNSKTLSEGAPKCDCNDGYSRLQDDPWQLGCTKPPSAPVNLSIHHLSSTALILTWDAPADLGGREEVLYDVKCHQKTGEPHAQWVSCADTTHITPACTRLTETMANITGLHPYVNYHISVRAHNSISAILRTSDSVQSITVWKTAISPTPMAPVRQFTPPVIVGVLCGILMLLALTTAGFYFLCHHYSPLRRYRSAEEQEAVPLPQTTSSPHVLDSVSNSLLHGIRDVLVDCSRLTLGKEIGKGEFGAVYEGIFSPQEGENIKVAVKTMKVGIYSEDDLQSFLKEAEIMQHFDHDNVVKLLGVTLERQQDSSIPVPLVILPFLKHGDLRRFLIATRYGDIPMFVPHQSLLRFMVDIATGMEYLSSKGFLHRDLAARNCMLGDDLRVRVADFGLSKQILCSDYYRQRVAIRMPIKWMAIESLSESVYTTKSDVWSFGVTMWEIMSRGKTPYPGIPNHELLELLEGGHRIKQGDCDNKLYEVMLSCWHKDPSQRPCFAQLGCVLKALLSELPPLEASMEAHYINQGLELANGSQSSAAGPVPDGTVGNLYLPAPVSGTYMEGYLLCNNSET